MKSGSLQTQRIRPLLEQWGEYMSCRDDHRLGYPTRSTIGRLIDDGGVLPRSKSPYTPQVGLPDDVRAVEESLIRLRNEGFRDQVEAVILLYAGRNKYRSESARAKKMGKKVSQYRVLIRTAHDILFGRLLDYLH